MRVAVVSALVLASACGGSELGALDAAALDAGAGALDAAALDAGALDAAALDAAALALDARGELETGARPDGGEDARIFDTGAAVDSFGASPCGACGAGLACCNSALVAPLPAWWQCATPCDAWLWCDDGRVIECRFVVGRPCDARVCD